MNDATIETLRELESKATPGPWVHDIETDYVWGPEGEIVASDLNGMTVRGHGAGLPMDINGELMCAARNALPELLDELASETRWADQYKRQRDTLQAKLDAAEARVEEFSDEVPVCYCGAPSPDGATCWKCQATALRDKLDAIRALAYEPKQDEAYEMYSELQAKLRVILDGEPGAEGKC